MEICPSNQLVSHKDHCFVVRQLDAKVEALKKSVDFAHEVHAKVIDDQNTMILFMKEKGILDEYYKRFSKVAPH